MIINLKKFQRGGSIGATIQTLTYTPVVLNQDAYGPAKQSVSETEEVKASSKSDKNSGELSRKDVLMALKDLKGLPNDVDMVASKLRNDFKIQNILQRNGLLSQSAIEDQYLKDIMYINRIKQSSRLFDSAFKNAQSKDSIQEYAISPSGQVFVQNQQGQVSAMSIQDYLKNKDSVRALTNGELLTLRRNSPTMAFQDSVFDTVQKGVTMKQVTDFIKTFAEGLAHQKVEYDGYTSVENGQIKQGMQLLKDAEKLGINLQMGEDGIYKITGATQDQQQAIQLALRTAYQAMPDQYKNLLYLYGGNANNPAAGAINIIAGLISSKNDTREVKFELSRTDFGSGSGRKSGKDLEEDINSSPLLNAALGNVKSEPFAIFAGTGSSWNTGYVVQGYKVDIPDLTSTNNTLDTLIPHFAGFGINMSSITFSGAPVDPSQTNKIVTTSNQATIVRMPISKDPSTGRISPILKAADLQNYKKAEETIKQNHISEDDFERINAVYEHYKLPPVYIKNRANQYEINSEAYAQFIMMPAQAEGSVCGEDVIEDMMDKHECWATECSDTEVKAFKGNFDKEGQKGIDDVYKGMLFIPINPDIPQLILQKNNNSATVKDMNEVYKRTQLYGGIGKPYNLPDQAAQAAVRAVTGS